MISKSQKRRRSAIFGQMEDVVNCCVKTTVVMYAFVVGPNMTEKETNGRDSWRPAIIVVELKKGSWQFDKNYM